MELPPLPRAPSATGGSFSPASRSIGVASILNATDNDDGPQSRRRKASQLESPSSSMHILPLLATSDPTYHATSAGATPTSMNFSSSVGERAPRRILTPRSPSLHRAASLNQLNPPSATLNTQYMPFAVSPRNRMYAIEPGTSGAPPLPTPPAAARQSYGFPAPTPPTHVARRASLGGARGMRPASESTSPRSSYSSYSQAGQTSPPALSAPAGMPTLSSAYSAGPESSSIGGPGVGSAPTSVGPDRQRPMGVPTSSSGGQNVYQMMTLETTSGTVQLPVDVQAASRVADEKRRRNAGASARFRQRRKEKEKEASSTISRLEQQVKELGEDMDFYKRERDYLAGVVLQVPGGDRHFPRPQSPRHRRSSSLAGPSSAGYVPIQEQGGRSPDDGRNLRRRTSTLSLPPPPQPQGLQGPPPPFQPSGYAPHTYGQPLAPQPPPPPPPTAQPGSGPLPSPLGARGTLPPPPGPPPLMQAPPQTGPWNPYANRRPGGNGPPPNRDGR
ncbi:hypothetical protein M409DRAFT_71179 [Zasmidium cellare ATCC 36951]|uniref:BZIP domain-containing protein n=1 Tax=Zasmidium cellare ATCC 36951 TaxID=1080233 RepID=A0A6A6BX66_ZASCE|nr:uncharacterized protein M409DRAFT_71179 [Zasmidium cellare ATCC 36951]KAF2159295.1 hypothetical protein M409DRAFT_71179 [Zasmidium cellare ATCC 36951]